MSHVGKSCGEKGSRCSPSPWPGMPTDAHGRASEPITGEPVPRGAGVELAFDGLTLAVVLGVH